mmetsp:Transcript_25753/g.48005  ORF Transcript_25753/g.48005 Transcript_25753/m.48005 type:complete len:206 (+) Transcript_25753:3-620(+)
MSGRLSRVAFVSKDMPKKTTNGITSCKYYYMARTRPNDRRLFSSSSPSSSKPDSSKTKDPPRLQNLALASVLFGFVTYVFLYSMNAVGGGRGSSIEEGSNSNNNTNSNEDPLAQFKAEAYEARELAASKRKLSPEEIQALESGMQGRDDNDSDEYEVVEVAVAAPADIAAMEEEANLKVFRQRKQQGGETDAEPPKKKPWWRFGF